MGTGAGADSGTRGIRWEVGAGVDSETRGTRFSDVFGAGEGGSERGDSGTKASEGVGEGVRRIQSLSESRSGDLGLSTEDGWGSSVSFSNSTGDERRGGQRAMRSLKFSATAKYIDRSRTGLVI